MVISDKYEVLAQIGLGGMGTVYQVRHTVLDTILALKVLARELVDDPAAQQRFQREARIVASLVHPNIVRVFDIDRDAELDFTYIVMEYLHGQTLERRLREGGPLPLVEGLSVGIAIASALAHAHDNDPPVIHRDVKPANIMLEDGTGRTVVMDFGIAKQQGTGDLTHTGMALGTIKYSPPEQVRGDPLTPKADIYSLGMVLYETFTGRQFFAGMENAGIVGRLLYEPGNNEVDLGPDAPEALRTTLARAVAKNPDDRQHDMHALRQSLEACRDALARSGASAGAARSSVAPLGDVPASAEDDLLDADAPAWEETLPDDAWVLGNVEGTSPVAPRRRRWVFWLVVGTLMLAAGFGAAAIALSPLRWFEEPRRLVLPDESQMRPPVREARVVATPAAGVPAASVASEPTAAPASPVASSAPVAAPAPLATSVPTVTVAAVATSAPARAVAPTAKDTSAPVVTVVPGGTVAPGVTSAPARTAVPTANEMPATPVVASPPPNRPPTIVQRSPAESTITARLGEEVVFSVETTDPEDDPLTHAWVVDGRQRARGRRYAHRATEIGNHQVDVHVDDSEHEIVRARWQLRVVAPPKIGMFTPHARQVTLLETQSRVFGVQVEGGDTAVTNVRHRWRLDGRDVGTDPLFELEAAAVGRHDVDVAATLPSGAILRHHWAVQVESATTPGVERAVVRAPIVLAKDLDDRESADRKTLRLVGSVQNVDDRPAENIVVWVLALGTDGATILRQSALPIPQPLAPDAIATFELVLPNIAAIERFKVQVVSR